MPAVRVLHGIWNAQAWVRPLAWRLSARGFDAQVFGYRSITAVPQAAIDCLAQCLGDGPPTHLVGYSLGGLIALETLRRYPQLPVPRLVCLGSPLRGSATARALLQRGWGGLLGRSGPLLDHGCQPWHGPTQVAMVAGLVPRGVGRLLGAVGTDSDGTVALAETRLPGLADHCCVPASHTGLAFSPQAARQVAAFLRCGRFQR
ncbi:alpha/beta fold hydrolase [Pseudoxanthomonas spadix]|nr:alpha/beta fold hydrolase [Pseudoxanthomonas spadix]MBP3974231.1 alpha/beta fold hydrolase [Pseudoxanthomonas spadix]RMW94713.1 alpha/beta fold hydrolase [Pseudoxanthomonas spadix]